MRAQKWHSCAIVSPVDNNSDGNNCFVCPVGYYCPSPNTNKQACPSGTTSFEGSMSSADCTPTGYYY